MPMVAISKLAFHYIVIRAITPNNPNGNSNPGLLKVRPRSKRQQENRDDPE